MACPSVTLSVVLPRIPSPGGAAQPELPGLVKTKPTAPFTHVRVKGDPAQEYVVYSHGIELARVRGGGSVDLSEMLRRAVAHDQGVKGLRERGCAGCPCTWAPESKPCMIATGHLFLMIVNDLEYLEPPGDNDYRIKPRMDWVGAAPADPLALSPEAVETHDQTLRARL